MGPPVGIVRQLDFEFAYDCAIDNQCDAALLRAGLDRQVHVAVLKGQLARDVAERSGRLSVGEDDVVNIDVAPTAGRPVHDLQPRRLRGQVTDVPARWLQALAAAGICVRASGRADDPTVHDQVDAGLVCPSATADEEVDRPAIDRECRRGQRTNGPIATEEGIDESPALESLHGHLVRQGCVCGPSTEGRALDFPGAVVRALEVGDQDVGRLGMSRGRCRAPHQCREPENHGLHRVQQCSR